MTDPHVTVVVDEGLGNTSYLVDLGDGRALAVDPSRDLRALRAAAMARGLTVAYAADTHLHADFLSGACQLAAADDARILASRAGDRMYTHTALDDGDEVDLGGLRLQILSTPGHTHEHIAYLLLDGARPVGVFTGGSLIVGAAARTDLVDPRRTEELARAQYASVQRLLTLADATAVWPTHGAGSFCSAPPGADRTSTIGRERATNPLVQAPGEDAFVDRLLGSLGTFPPYFLRLGAINRSGPAILDETTDALRSVAVERFAELRGDGATVLDVRPIDRFAAAHIPGSVSVELRPALATWLGWVVPDDRPVLVIRDPDQDPAEIRWQASKIGYDILGELNGGLAAWTAAGYATKATALRAPGDVPADTLVDIRQESEFTAGHVPGARNVELGSVETADLPSERSVFMCGHGERGMTAASLLERAGRTDLAVLLGGPDDWVRAHGSTLATDG